MDRKALRSLLVERRSAIDPASRGLPQSARTTGLTQAQVDQLLHRVDAYRMLEAGRIRSPALMEEVALLLDFTEQEWVKLWLYARGQHPPKPLYPETGQAVPGAWQELLDGQTHMAYITDRRWRIVAYNTAFADMFPHGTVPDNLMRWMVLDPSARTTLTGWEHHWAPPVLAQLRAAVAEYSDDKGLADLEKEVLADPVIGPIYTASWSANVYPNGDQRPLNHTSLGPGWVTICTFWPGTAQGARGLFLIFHPGERRSPRAPMLMADQAI